MHNHFHLTVKGFLSWTLLRNFAFLTLVGVFILYPFLRNGSADVIGIDGTCYDAKDNPPGSTANQAQCTTVGQCANYNRPIARVRMTARSKMGCPEHTVVNDAQTGMTAFLIKSVYGRAAASARVGSDLVRLQDGYGELHCSGYRFSNVITRNPCPGYITDYGEIGQNSNIEYGPLTENACSTPASSGYCPPGLFYSGFGRCCYESARQECEAYSWFFNLQDGSCSSSPSSPPSCPTYCDSPYGVDRDMCMYPQSDGCYADYLPSGNCCMYTPIVIDVLGNGFNFTNLANGVYFDIGADGSRELQAWPATGSDDAWLALDRNGNGTIDNNRELFGNATPQPTPPQGTLRNGFLALAEYDKPANGGNNDGQITSQDAIFSSLRLWQDTNHNGISEPSELKTLPALNVRGMELRYVDRSWRDQHGNNFRYHSGVYANRTDPRTWRWASDVILLTNPRDTAP